MGIGDDGSALLNGQRVSRIERTGGAGTGVNQTGDRISPGGSRSEQAENGRSENA